MVREERGETRGHELLGFAGRVAVLFAGRGFRGAFGAGHWKVFFLKREAIKVLQMENDFTPFYEARKLFLAGSIFGDGDDIKAAGIRVGKG